MVDCGNLRCFQERRSIKKELLSWSKKVPVAVGLEAIAEQFGSKRKLKRLFEPWNCLETKEPKDWEPEENCFYCKDRIQLLFDAIEQTEDSKDGSRILKDHPSLRHLPDVLPFCPQFYTSNFGRDILLDIKSCQNEPEPPPPAPEPAPKPNVELKIPALLSSSKQKKEILSNGKKGYTDNDLSSAVTEIRNGKLGTRRASSLYGIPRSTLRNKMFKMETDDVNLAAILQDDDDSSSDDLPPLKLPLQQQQAHNQQQQDRPLQLEDLLQISTLQYLAPIAMPFMFKPDMSMLVENTEWERKLQNIRHKHNINNDPMNHYLEKSRLHKLKPYQNELIKKLTKERLEIEKNANHVNYDLSLNNNNNISHSSLPHEDAKSFTHSIILKALEQNTPHLQLAQQLKSQQNELQQQQQQHKHQLQHRQLLDQLALTPSQSALMKALNMEPSLMSAVSSSLENLSDIIVPTYASKSGYKNKSSVSVKNENSSPSPSPDKKGYEGFYKYENTRIGDTLKDIIVKTISEKVRCKLESTDFSGLVGGGSNFEKQKTKETLLSAFSIPMSEAASVSPAKKIKQEIPDIDLSPPRSQGRGHNSSGSSSQTKKTRPKRGQYRKYNSQLLTEAVKAVNRGEMSVHRAGSYYGVPHSTLEYKVKERHLIRQKKIKEQQEQKQKEAADETKKKEDKTNMAAQLSSTAVGVTAALSDKSSSSESESPTKPFQGASWLPPFVGQSPFDGASPLGLFGSGFALSTPASELLRKLQHKVQSKSEVMEEDNDESLSYPSAPSSEGYIYIR